MTGFARLRDTFLAEREPQSALFCTYGFDAGFFEGELLPALYPISLGTDREAGSKQAYQGAADLALLKTGVGVFFDHLSGEAPELVYESWRVDVAPRCFHPKLAVLDYGDTIRVVVSSANLTRSAWSSLLELFVVEDLVVGTPHPWAQELEIFLKRLSGHVPAGTTRPDVAIELAARVAQVPAGPGESRLASSWERPVLDAFLDGITHSQHVDIVTPFFEGEEGPGLFDELHRRLGSKLRGTIWTTVEASEQGPTVRGPEEKLQDLFKSGLWDLRAVGSVWQGDEEDAPLRSLHGKILAVRQGEKVRLVVGSPNATRAAMLGVAPRGNVELGVVVEVPVRRLKNLLPQGSVVRPEEVRFIAAGDPTGEDGEGELGADRWIVSALYTAADRRLDLVRRADAPPLGVSYAGQILGNAFGSPWSCELAMGAERFVVVDDGATSAAVPFVVVDPEQLEPRWTVPEPSLEGFCEVLAGFRDPAVSSNASEPKEADAFGANGESATLAVRGPIPWRRFIVGVQGLGKELDREADSPRGLAFVLRNPARLRGLLTRLDHAVSIGRFTAADHAYALYELDREVRRASSGAGRPAECAEMFADALDDLKQRRAASIVGASALLLRQLELLGRADSA